MINTRYIHDDNINWDATINDTINDVRISTNYYIPKEEYAWNIIFRDIKDVYTGKARNSQSIAARKDSTPIMHFPPQVTNAVEKQAQKMNYDYFIHTMADMMRKYAPELLD